MEWLTQLFMGITDSFPSILTKFHLRQLSFCELNLACCCSYTGKNALGMLDIHLCREIRCLCRERESLIMKYFVNLEV